MLTAKLASRLLRNVKQPCQLYGTRYEPFYNDRGNRKIVGWGTSGHPFYFDHHTNPFPAVRYLPDTPEVLAMREKEKGDWRNLSMDDKERLYRNSFRHTWSEIKADKHSYCSDFGIAFMYMGTVIWLYMGVRYFIISKPMPDCFTEESQRLYAKRFIEEERYPIFGIASEWDYENWRWKK